MERYYIAAMSLRGMCVSADGGCVGAIRFILVSCTTITSCSGDFSHVKASTVLLAKSNQISPYARLTRALLDRDELSRDEEVYCTWLY